ncbi:MAG: flagellar filament capping protein FliD [Planctomycetota bacterium]|nr:flagellar filament capping protein FliD [Planctomycetota bacterium]
MGTITTGIGLISGIDTAGLIDSLIELESRGKLLIEQRVVNLRAQQTALLDINSRLANFRSAVDVFRNSSVFRKALASSSNEDILTANAGLGASPGTYKFIVQNLVSTSQKLSQGYATKDASPLGLTSMGFEFGQGNLARDLNLEVLNGGSGITRGKIIISDGNANSATIDLTDVTTLNEIIERINSETSINVTAAAQGDHLIITDNTGGASVLQVQDATGYTTATDLGIAAMDGGTGDDDATVNGIIQGRNINFIGLNTPLSSLNDGNGVLIIDNVDDIRIQPKTGAGEAFGVDFGRLNEPITDETLLADLNDGAGITINSDEDEADLLIVGRDGTEYEVDLTGVTTVGQLRNRIATETTGITLTIEDGDHFDLNYISGGGGGNFKVLGAGTNDTKTAEDLGILNETGVASTVITGDLILSNALSEQAQTLGDIIDRINNDEDNIDTGLPEGRKVTASIATDGVSLLLTDHTGGGSNMKILEGFTNAHAVHDLGIYAPSIFGQPFFDGSRVIASMNSVMVEHLNGGDGLNTTGTVTLAGTTNLSDLLQGAGITTDGNASSPDIFIQDRDGLTYNVEVDGLTTVQDLIDAFNTATGGVVTLSINGQSLRAENFSNGASNFQITDLNGAAVATELGIVGDLDNPGGDIIDGVDTQPQGPVVGDSFTLTDRNGNSVVIGSLDSYVSLSEIIDAVNTQAASAFVDIVMSLNANGNGLKFTDTSGGSGNLIVTGTAATALGVDTTATGVGSNEVLGSSLQLQYVSEATKLADLNYGRGVGTGGIKITDGLGNSVTISIGKTEETIYEVIAEINALTSAKDVKVVARINDNGDGIIIESNYDPADVPFVPIKIEASGGTAAADLNLIGESETIDNASINGTYEQVIDFLVSDTLEDVLQKIIDAKVPINATIINTGSPASPFRLNLTSDIAGAAGEMFIDTGGVDLGFTTLSTGVDAKLFFGGDTPETGFLVTANSNKVEDIIPGLTLNLVKASSEVIKVEVKRDIEAIVEAASQFTVTFNDAIQRIDALDYFDIETEERGVLLGDPTTSQIRQLLLSNVIKAAEGVDTQYQRLSQVGIRIGKDSQLEFDDQKFRDAYENDRIAVENLFLALKADTATTEEIAPGVTITKNETTTTARGMVAIFSDLIDRMLDPIDGIFTRADDSFKTRIEQFEDRIERLDERLLASRAQLQRQFLAMEISLARLQGQNGALSSLSLLVPIT